ncbi:hypothetical protein COUCH_27615 [Couchioplanes caeruleus]|uniref:hypothetical protein n=1 Tax=Couchioplanes caeruleus TaxID=56438 RepID=UPI0020C136AD|nr:hypothetical protein [Couchioplanes caeruleus]UQU62785.1 hypothetical protein COUCH_27615 [Couchioplanes caeruleus]
MIKLFAGLALGAVLALTGCTDDDATTGKAAAAAPASSAPANTDAVCKRWMAAQQPFLMNTAPEAKAYAKAMADSYQGKKTAGAQEIQRAYWSGWADAVRPLVAQADTPALKAALTAEVTELDRRATARTADASEQAFGPIQELCLHAGGPGPTVGTVQ